MGAGGPVQVTGRRSATTSTRQFDDFYVAHYRAVVALAYALSGSRAGAEDLAQEAFVAVLRRWDDVRDFDDPGVWVRRVVANRSVSAVRRRLAEGRALTRLGGAPPPLPDVSADTHDVWRAVRRLPRRQAQAIALHYLEDMSLDRVALVLGCSVETVRTHLKRGRSSLGRALAVEEAP